MDADAVIEALDLASHPEGGYYRETWVDASSSAIYFLLRDRLQSRWHRVHDRTEIWHFYAGAPLELSIDERGDGRQMAMIRLGCDLHAGEQPQAVVPADAWQRARSTGDWSLVGCTVAPPFTFAAFEMRG
jgi:predicted cupin superfamily sugar epimerase